MILSHKIIDVFCERWIVFLISLVVYLFLFKYVFRKAGILIHEFSHLLVALIYGRKVGKIRVWTYDGSIEIENTNAMIDLAPYYLPLVPLLIYFALSFLEFAHESNLIIIHVFYLLYVCRLISQLSLRQPDLRRWGICNSLVMILVLNLYFIFLFIELMR